MERALTSSAFLACISSISRREWENECSSRARTSSTTSGDALWVQKEMTVRVFSLA